MIWLLFQPSDPATSGGGGSNSCLWGKRQSSQTRRTGWTQTRRHECASFPGLTTTKWLVVVVLRRTSKSERLLCKYYTHLLWLFNVWPRDNSSTTRVHPRLWWDKSNWIENILLIDRANKGIGPWNLNFYFLRGIADCGFFHGQLSFFFFTGLDVVKIL